MEDWAASKPVLLTAASRDLFKPELYPQIAAALTQRPAKNMEEARARHLRRALRPALRRTLLAFFSANRHDPSHPGQNLVLVRCSST